MKTIHFHIKTALLIACILCYAPGCAAARGQAYANAPLTKEDFMLNTIVQITLYDGGSQATLDGAFALCKAYEDKLSRTIDTSEISKINAANGKPVTVSPETAEVLRYGKAYGDKSGGMFDITIGGESSLWKFDQTEPHKPDDADIQKALPSVGYQGLMIDGDIVTLLKPGAQIDLGAIAKGYIADRLKDYLVQNGVRSAIIDLGGNILTMGDKNGAPFRIGVRKPFTEDKEVSLVLEVKEKSVVTSGIYERYFYDQGAFYHHILDPRTGYPVANDLASVTIVSNLSVDGDGLSTTCFCLGKEKGLALIESLPDVEAIFLDKKGNLSYSSGIGTKIKMEYN